MTHMTIKKTMLESISRFKSGKGDLLRIRKDSFYWYKKCIESNGEDLA